jgi:hypothetical protein
MTQQLAPWFSTPDRSIKRIPAEQLWLSLLPSGQRQQARDGWHTVEHDIGAFLHGHLIHGLVAGLLLGLGYWLLGSPFPAFLTLAGVLACLLPVVGPALVLIPVAEEADPAPNIVQQMSQGPPSGAAPLPWRIWRLR